MTVLTGRCVDWNDLLAPSRRFEEGGSRMSIFPIADTFEGEVIDPQSLHKYLYAHADPVDNTDPSGQFIGALGGLVGLMVGSFISAKADITLNSAAASGGLSIIARLALLSAKFLAPGIGVVGGYGVTAWQISNALESAALWEIPVNMNVPVADWVDGIETILKKHVNAQPGVTAQQIYDGHAAAERIAWGYVRAVQKRAISVFGIEDASETMFGKGGGWANWRGNVVSWFTSGFDRNCERWAMDVYDAMKSAGVTGGWKLRGHFGTLMAGDFSLGWAFKHNFVSLTFDPNHTGASPAFILDPWTRATGHFRVRHLQQALADRKFPS
jgi:hypothetical protein